MSPNSLGTLRMHSTMGLRRWLGLMTIEFPELGCTTGGCRCFPLGSVVDEPVWGCAMASHRITERRKPLCHHCPFTLHQMAAATQVDFRCRRYYYYMRCNECRYLTIPHDRSSEVCHEKPENTPKLERSPRQQGVHCNTTRILQMVQLS